MSYKSYSTSRGVKINLMDYPIECPECHSRTTPNYHSNGFSKDEKKLYAFLSCPNPNCDKFYVAQYEGSNNTFFYKNLVLGKPKSEIFSFEIEQLSPLFIKIYNEAFTAEQLQLLEISGVGYRKALEFLIKDYLIKSIPEKSEIIKSMFLGKCKQHEYFYIEYKLKHDMYVGMRVFKNPDLLQPYLQQMEIKLPA